MGEGMWIMKGVKKYGGKKKKKKDGRIQRWSNVSIKIMSAGKRGQFEYLPDVPLTWDR